MEFRKKTRCEIEEKLKTEKLKIALDNLFKTVNSDLAIL
jgi:hypothetical protein